jgi:hypothetical protein
MSRRFGLPGGFGFFAKLVAVLDTGGGVTAGSVASNPSDFLVNEVVAIQKNKRLRIPCRGGPAIQIVNRRTAFFILKRWT